MRIKPSVLAVVVLTLIGVAYKACQRQLDRQYQQIVLSSVEFADKPRQFDLDSDQQSFTFKGFQLKPMARFVMRARILSREDYSWDVASALSPMDLALGWSRMAEPAVYEALRISQGNRWYRYAWKNQPPIPAQEIIESSANMHLIPANDFVERMLRQAERGKIIKLKGMLVDVSRDNDDGYKFYWESSLSRADSDAGACEIVFVEAAEIE